MSSLFEKVRRVNPEVSVSLPSGTKIKLAALLLSFVEKVAGKLSQMELDKVGSLACTLTSTPSVPECKTSTLCESH